MRYLTIVVLLALTLGCGAHLGKVEPKLEKASAAPAEVAQECKGITFLFGDATGPCGMKGGTISIPGATLVGGIFKAAAEIVGGFFGNLPVVIQHNDSESAPEG